MIRRRRGRLVQETIRNLIQGCFNGHVWDRQVRDFECAECKNSWAAYHLQNQEVVCPKCRSVSIWEIVKD
jgi:hypothetical protein